MGKLTAHPRPTNILINRGLFRGPGAEVEPPFGKVWLRVCQQFAYYSNENTTSTSVAAIIAVFKQGRRIAENVRCLS